MRLAGCRPAEASSILVGPAAGRYGSGRPERSAKASGREAARVRVPHLPPRKGRPALVPGARLEREWPHAQPGGSIPSPSAAGPRSVPGDAPGLYPGESGSTPDGGSGGRKRRGWTRGRMVFRAGCHAVGPRQVSRRGQPAERATARAGTGGSRPRWATRFEPGGAGDRRGSTPRSSVDDNGLMRSGGEAVPAGFISRRP